MKTTTCVLLVTFFLGAVSPSGLDAEAGKLQVVRVKRQDEPAADEAAAEDTPAAEDAPAEGDTTAAEETEATEASQYTEPSVAMDDAGSTTARNRVLPLFNRPGDQNRFKNNRWHGSWGNNRVLKKRRRVIKISRNPLQSIFFRKGENGEHGVNATRAKSKQNQTNGADIKSKQNQTNATSAKSKQNQKKGADIKITKIQT